MTKYLHCSHFVNLCIVAKISIFCQDVWPALIVPRCIHSSSKKNSLFDFPPYLKMSNWWATGVTFEMNMTLPHLPVLPSDPSICINSKKSSSSILIELNVGKMLKTLHKVNNFILSYTKFTRHEEKMFPIDVMDPELQRLFSITWS